MRPLKIVLLYLSYWWGLIKSFSFCYCWSEGTPGGSNTCILCCSDPFLLGARRLWAAEKLQAPLRNRETPRKPEEKEVSDQIKFSCSVGESENSKRRILSPRGGNCACPGVRSACGFGCLVHAGLMWDCLDGTTGLHTLCLEQGVWAREDHGLSLSSSLPSLAQLMTTGLGGQWGRIPTTSSVSPLSPRTGKWVMVFSHSLLLISLLAFPLRVIPHKTSPSSGNIILPSVGVWVEME